MVKYLGIIALTWLFVRGSEPVQFFKSFLKIGNESQPKDIFRQLSQKLLNCCLCSGFWIGLAFYQDIYMACIISLSCEALDKIIRKMSNYFTEI